MESLCIIPARKGSKGILNKNLRMVFNKPLISYAIERAKDAHMVNRVVVSTDGEEIATISNSYGAEVIMRPSDISGDKDTSEVALLHVLDYLYKEEGYQPDIVVFTQCTSPMTLPEDIDGTVKMMLDENADSAFGVIPFHGFLWERNNDGDTEGINHRKNVRIMRQDINNQFIETGGVYCMRTEGFKKAKHRFFGKTVFYVIPQTRYLEIDEPIDLIIAETVMEYQKNSKK